MERKSLKNTIEFEELLSSFDMCQNVSESTHKAGGWLDVIVTRNSEKLADICVTETGISDHSLVTCRIPVDIAGSQSFPVEGRKWSKFSLDGFANDLAQSILCDDIKWTKSVSVDELFATYNNVLTDLIDKHAPRYMRKRKHRILSPWFDDECRQMKRSVRRLERRYRKSNCSSDRLDWVKKLQESASLYRNKECHYWSSRINANASDPRRLWKDLDDLMRKQDELPVLTPSEASQRAEEFKNFFDNKISSIRLETKDASSATFECINEEQKFMCFSPVTADQIINLISKASNKQCSLDPIPTSIVKDCSSLLAPFISEIFNRSLKEGYMPVSQKIAYVRPHLKKHGLDSVDTKNYRPVSNLSFLSKLLEKVVSVQLNEFLKSTNSIPALQSAYRKFHSTETGLLKVFSDLCKAIDDGNVCLLGLLDLSAAFDTVDYEILLNRLEKSFGIEASALSWLKSYLSDRSQIICINGSKSTSSKLLSGVPQGSILGPLLFILYTAPVTDIIRHHGLLSHCYADDTQLYFYCSPDQMDALSCSFSTCISELEKWMFTNRLKLNCDKTEFLWIASRRRFNNLSNIPTINVMNSGIIASEGARNLGVFFDKHLDMKHHITNVCRH